jgi:hypothetical protein
MCNAQDNGSLLFRDKLGRTMVIIAAGQWLTVEKEKE